MPELPEVETVVREIRPHLLGRRLGKIQVSDRPLRRQWRGTWVSQLRGRRIDEVRRRGKWIIVSLDGAYHLIIHLGMTGQLTVHDTQQAMADHTHLVFELRPGGRQLRYRDIRRFGSATLVASQRELDHFFEASSLGPEPFQLARQYWRERLAGTRRCLKAVLLDQQVIAGVGNIYADESLHEARLSPYRQGCALSSAEADRLRRAIATVLRRAIDRRGSTIRNYIGGSGLQGSYQDEFRAYGRVDKPCKRCQAPIVRVRLAGRSTYYCPRCQGD